MKSKQRSRIKDAYRQNIELTSQDKQINMQIYRYKSERYKQARRQVKSQMYIYNLPPAQFSWLVAF